MICQNPNCRKTFEKRPKDGKRKRRFCTRACSNRSTRGRRRLPDEQYRSRYRSDEHRAVAAKKIGRPLRPEEQVHHRNERRLDNRKENLEVLTREEHGRRHTKLPTTKTCVICGRTFAPHKTKRRRQQTCARRDCVSALLRQRWRERKALA